MNNDKRNSKVIFRTILTGIVAGFLFLMFFSLAVYFSFVEKRIINILPLFNKLETISGSMMKFFLSLIVILTLSVLTSLIYYTLLRRFANIWISLLYGLLLFLIFLLFVLREGDLANYSLTTFVTIGALFIIYGTFIGYSISFDYVEENKKKKIDRSN